MKSAKTTKRKKVRTKTAVSKSTSNIETRSTDKRLLKLKHGQTWLKTVTVVNKSMLVTKKKDHSDSESKELGSYQDRINENGSNDRALARTEPKSLQLLRIHELEGEGGGYVKKALSLPLVEKPKREDKKSSGGVTALLSSLTLSPRIPGTKSKSDKEKEEKEREKKEKKEREEREKREKKEKEERERKEKKEKEERDKKDKKEKEKEKDKDKEEMSQEEKEMELVTAKLKKHPVFSNVDPMVAGTVDGMMNEYFTPQKLRKINGEFAIKAKLQFVAMSMFSFKKLKYAPSIVLSTISEAVSEFGLVHAAVQIGPYRLDWNRAEISLPKEIRCDSEPLMLLDLKGGDLYVGYDYNKVAEICRKVCEISVRWNRTMHYSLGSHCQHFVNEVLETLNLQMEFEEPIDGYLRKLRKHGTAKMQFKDPFTHKKVKFKRHADIDRYANNLLARFPRFAEDYPNHWMFLKAFDRAFWACQMSYESSDESESDDDVTSLVEGKEREKDKHAAEKAFWMCPFGNPMDLLFGSFAGGVLETAMKSEDDFLRSLNKEPAKSTSKSDRLKRFDSDEVDTTEIKNFLEEKRKLKEKKEKEDRESEEDVNIRPEVEVSEPEEPKEKDEDWKQLRKQLRLEKEAKKARNLRTRSLPKSMANKRNSDDATKKNYASQIQSYRTPALSKRREPTIEELKAELEPITISARRREFKRNETRMKVAELRKKVRQKMEDIERRTMLKEDHNVALLPTPSHAVDTTASADNKGSLSVSDQKNRKRSSVDHNLLWMVGEDLVGSNDSPATPKRGNSLRGSPAIEMEEEGEHQLPPIAIVVETNGASSLRTSPEHDGEEEEMQGTEKEEKEKKQKEEKQRKKKEKRKQKQQEKQEQIEKGGGEQPSLQPPGVTIETHKEKV